MTANTFEAVREKLPALSWEQWYEALAPAVRARVDEYPPGFYLHLPSGRLVQILAYSEEIDDARGVSRSDVCVVCASDWVEMPEVPYTDLRRVRG